MTILEAVDIVKQKYEIEPHAMHGDIYSIETGLLMSMSAYVFICLYEHKGEIILDDYSCTVKYTLKDRNQVAEICKKYGATVRPIKGDIEMKFESIESVDKYIEMIKEIVCEDGKIPDEILYKRQI